MADWLPRFLAKIDTSGGPDACHPWTGAFNTPAEKTRPWRQTRRPVFKLVTARDAQVVVYAHRLALSVYDGVPLDRRAGVEACHKLHCANPACCNATHLYWGTPEENRADRYQPLLGGAAARAAIE